ncbi:MAG: alpha/beta fold hydrolase [Candidatus Nanopelagicales bacterium]|nr:alpha/beta fold hydrolase [Candidatus Nanopelagicales bacterium]
MRGPSAPAPATLPPADLPGLDPSWSRLITCDDGDGIARTWHVLDTQTPNPRVTVLAVHGNPTWSYLWRRVLASAPADVRVVAVDQLGMGFSERLSTQRRLGQRIDDLGRLAAALEIDGPVVVLAHDWGGPISVGWALAHRLQVRGLVLTNTAVHQPSDSGIPRVIAMARVAPLRTFNTQRLPIFLRITTALSGSRMTPEIRHAFWAPYIKGDRRAAISDFVEDIPVKPSHPSAAILDEVAEGIRGLQVPTLMLWGPGDPVFSDRYLNDLRERMPHAQVHRYEGARHLVIEDAPSLVDDFWMWMSDLDATRHDVDESTVEFDGSFLEESLPLWHALEERARTHPHEDAIVEPAGSGHWKRISWRQLHHTVELLARGLAGRGIKRGDRVAVLVTPGADLIATIYACWRIGVTVVIVDAALGVRGIRRALRSARPTSIIAIPKAIPVVQGLGANVIASRQLARIAAEGKSQVSPAHAQTNDEAIVVFTSGSTGPAKGVVYQHEHIARTRDLIVAHLDITERDALVAAFAPWAVLGPALGIASVIPDMDVTRPATLTAKALGEAVHAVGGTVLWGSPAALRAVVATQDGLRKNSELNSLRLVMGAGAPVSRELLQGMKDLCPTADVRTPYGMTEVLPVCDVSLEEIISAGDGPGVLVGHPVDGVEVRISALDHQGMATGPLSDSALVLGEVVVRAPHMKDRYDSLWATQRRSSRDAGWHRTGDVGELDDFGRLWIGGRLAHVITTASGPIAPVAIEQRMGAIPDVVQAAAVGVGPLGNQQVVIILETNRVVDLDLIDEVRSLAQMPVAAVLARTSLPVDIRHRSKVDRRALAVWANQLLAGRS